MGTKHTPIPWHIGMRDNHANSDKIYAYTGSDRHNDPAICSVYGLYMNQDLSKQEQGEPLANAQFIVRACNTHDELVRVARAALRFIDKLHKDYTPHIIPPNSDSGLDWDVRGDLREIIHKATGK